MQCQSYDSLTVALRSFGSLPDTFLKFLVDEVLLQSLHRMTVVRSVMAPRSNITVPAMVDLSGRRV